MCQGYPAAEGRKKKLSSIHPQRPLYRPVIFPPNQVKHLQSRRCSNESVPLVSTRVLFISWLLYVGDRARHSIVWYSII